jgi:hypothetical protein
LYPPPCALRYQNEALLTARHFGGAISPPE